MLMDSKLGLDDWLDKVILCIFVTPKMTATNENYIDEEIKRR
jgi:hypothetical protein